MKKTIITLAFYSIAIFAEAAISPVGTRGVSPAIKPDSNTPVPSVRQPSAGPVHNEYSLRTISSQEVPAPVVAAFSSKFPNAHLRNWEIQRGVFIANFRLDRKKIFAYFNPDGSWRGTESPIRWTKNLPSAVHSGWLKSDYAGWYVQDIKKIETPEGPLYTLHVDNGPTLDSDHHDIDFEECVIFFNGSGSLVRKDRMP